MKHEVQQALARTLGRWFRNGSAGRRVVLCYHSIDGQGPNASATPEQFEQQLDWLQEHCHVVSFREILEAAPGRRPLVAVTFDDGYADNYEHAFPSLVRRGLPATFFLTSGWIEKDPAVGARFWPARGLEWGQIREMAAAGLEFGAHSRSHPNLAELAPAALREELRRSKEVLEQRLDAPVVSLAYPFGRRGVHYNETTVAAAAEAGYRYGATVECRPLEAAEQPLEIPRFVITGDSVEGLRDKVLGAWDYLGWWQRRVPLCGSWDRSSPGAALRWIRKGTFALLDQALCAGTNFLLSVLLARWLAPAGYGAYALAFSFFLLFAALYNGLILEPMGVLGLVAYQDRRRGYVGALLSIHAVLGGLAMLALGAGAATAGLVFPHAELAAALAGLALAAPCILLLWLARASCYLDLAPGPAARAAVLYSAVILGGLFAVNRLGQLSPFRAFVLMGAGSLIVSIWLLRRERPSRAMVREVIARHWFWGRWELGTALAYSVTQNVPFLLTGAALGMPQVGALRALLNLALPVNHTAVALQRLALPYVAGLSGRSGYTATRAPVRMMAWLFAAGGLAYFVAATAWREPLVQLLYGGNFSEITALVPAVALCVAVTSSTHGFLVGVRAMQRPALIFRLHCLEAGVLLAAGAPATWLFGLPGIIGAAVLASLARLAVAAADYRRVGHA